jgi:hypothetical protein
MFRTLFIRAGTLAESSAIRIRCRADAKFPELTFRALLTEGQSDLALALV